jgi:phospholipid/cholesterol/gamma-HCH transport system substrate-binding protein
MRRARGDLIRVGLFVTAAGTLLVGGLLWIAGARIFRPVKTYRIVFDRSVTGLNAGANVEYQGVVVGRVRDIRLTGDIPPRVAVIVDIEPGTPVRTDTTAALIGSLVTGIKYIQFQGGSAEAAPLPTGGTVHGEVPSLELLGDRLTEIADRVADILRRLQENVFTEANGAKLTRALDDLGAVASTLNQAMETFRARETTEDVAHLIRRLGRVAERADAVLADFYGRRDAIYGTLERALRNLDAGVGAARELVRRADAQVGGTGRSLEGLIAELAAATNRLEETLDVIRSDPSVLLWGRSVPERERAR